MSPKPNTIKTLEPSLDEIQHFFKKLFASNLITVFSNSEIAFFFFFGFQET